MQCAQHPKLGEHNYCNVRWTNCEIMPKHLPKLDWISEYSSNRCNWFNYRYKQLHQRAKTPKFIPKSAKIHETITQKTAKSL